jgi:pyruvate kinase
MARARRTKIVATLGPAVDRPGALEHLLEAGADVLRVNLSHAPPPVQAERVARARWLKPEIAVLVDLAGPKLRLGDIQGEIPVTAGSVVELGGPDVPLGDPSVFARVRPGDPVYIADGTIHLEVVSVESTRIRCRAIVGGALRSRKGINLPADTSSLPCLTDKDRADLAALDVLDADYVALSYVRSEQDVESVRRHTRLPVIAKIEKQQAL